MTAARALRSPAAMLVACLLAGSAALGAAAPPVRAASDLPARLEAGPQVSVTFSGAWRVTSRRTTTLAAPVAVTVGARRTEPPGGTWLRITSGSLAGRWVREGPTAYVAGYAGDAAWSPARTLALPAGTWELYRFDDAGRMTEARPMHLDAPATLAADRSAVVRGTRHLRVAEGAWAGWWVPGSRSAPQPVTCTAGDPPAPASPLVVRAISEATGEIALTFDMGGRVTPARSIIRYLELTRTCATIFPTGLTAGTDTGEAVLAEVAAHPELFEVGNHTVHHCNLRDGGGGAACPDDRPSAAFVTAELRDADGLIAPLAGRGTAPYWRPPYGAVDKALRLVAADAGWPVTVMWSIDTIDWRTVAKGGPTAAQSAAKVIAGREAGAVVLMHLGGWTTRDALPAMIAGLRDRGYTPTTISALFRAGA